MEVVRSAEEFAEACNKARAGNAKVGLVPTMGAFHDGHISLMRAAREANDFTAVYLFVNPLQFAAGDDFERYPRSEQSDLAKAASEGMDLVFLPGVEDMYPNGYPPAETIDPGPIGKCIEGASRPGHFAGVLTVVARLFELAGVCSAYFGEKDAQQLFLIRRMAAERFKQTEVIACPTVRESDGLAISSRNVFLNEEDRTAALCLFHALQDAARLHLSGENDANVLKAEMARTIGAERRAGLDYVAIVSDATFEEIATLGEPARALVAAKFGGTRLIDNLRLG